MKKNTKKIPNKIKNIAEGKEIKFRINPFDDSLETHKLHGKLKGFWPFSIKHNYRIIFEISKNKEIFYFHSIGTHSVYK